MDINEEDVVKEEKLEPPIVLKFAPGWKRALAFFIDMVIVSIILSIMISFVFYRDLAAILQISDQSSWQSIVKSMLTDSGFQSKINTFMLQKRVQTAIASFIINASYFILFWRANGQTIGSKFLKIVVMSADRRKLNFMQGFFRYSVIYLASLAFYIPLLININPVFQQRIQDILSGSVVVEIPENSGNLNQTKRGPTQPAA